MSILATLSVGMGLLAASPAAAVEPIPASRGGVASSIVSAADLSTFTPGNLIADSVFFNSGTMSAAQIDTFFRSKVKTCQSGYVCLKDYRQNTPNRAADSYCDGYTGASNESAATIVYRVAVSCGINPQVLVVMLEKEQSLVTSPWPNPKRFAMAMGQGCPDTAGCDPAYAGFFYQVYGAARQMQIYAEGRWFTYYAPGKTWNIRYHPNAGCGTSPVYVQNTATAALYYYTPYQPNRAALNAGYGLGDACSSYGNRNFFQLFTDWFGDPRRGLTVSGAIAEVWNAQGGAAGWIGSPTGMMRSYNGSGWSQSFTNADIFVQAGRPGTIVSSPVREEYRYVGGVGGGLSWPTINRVPVAGGGYQDFVGGRMYVRPDGRAFSVSGQTYTTHESVNNISGFLGWPRGRAYPTADGWRQDFDSGSILQNAKTSAPLTADFVSLHDKLGGYGQFGSVTSGIVSDAVGSHVAFASGWIQKSAQGLIFVKGPLGSAYVQQGGASGPLGYVTSGERPLPSGVWTQAFTGGALYDTGRGVHAVTTFAKELAARGGPDVFGYPSGPEVVDGERRWQPFGSSSLGKASATGTTFAVRGAIGAHYAATGNLKSFLGAPTGNERTVNGGWTQDFQGGRILCSGHGTFSVPGSIAKALDANGGVTGRLGWPVAPAMKTADGWRQDFSGGTLVASATDSAKAGPIFGGILNTVRSFNAFDALGYPLERENLTSNGWRQRFERGTVFVPNSYPASVVQGSIHDLYQRIGGENITGVPTAPARTLAGGTLQDFQRFSMYTSPRGTWQSNGLIRDRYRATGGPAGALGWPVESLTTVSGGWRQLFASGGIYSSPFGTFVTKGALGAEYIRRGGEASGLGWPTGNEYLASGLWTQRFQNGILVLKADGTFEVR